MRMIHRRAYGALIIHMRANISGQIWVSISNYVKESSVQKIVFTRLVNSVTDMKNHIAMIAGDSSHQASSDLLSTFLNF